jgi:hypothetical protein
VVSAGVVSAERSAEEIEGAEEIGEGAEKISQVAQVHGVCLSLVIALMCASRMIPALPGNEVP